MQRGRDSSGIEGKGSRSGFGVRLESRLPLALQLLRGLTSQLQRNQSAPVLMRLQAVLLPPVLNRPSDFQSNEKRSGPRRYIICKNKMKWKENIQVLLG